MTPLEFWRCKVLQLLHDPPGKPYASYYRLRDAAPSAVVNGPKKKGGHTALAWKLSEQLGATFQQGISTRPDWAATGADRPVMGFHWQAKVKWGQLGHDPIATHPLSDAPLKLDGAHGEPRAAMPNDSFESQLSVIDGLKVDACEWNDAEALKKLFFRLWRRFRTDLLELDVPATSACWNEKPKESLLWQHMPADTRSPDHSIWDHNRITSALAFLEGDKKTPLPSAREPWLFSFALRSVQEFIAEARKSRDMWTNSMLLADLSWHAMLPVVRHYGPDVILYPDLNANPLVDRWLLDHPDEFPDLFSEDIDVNTGSALLPHHWIAVLPQGEQAHLVTLEKLGRECEEAVQERWHGLETPVRKRLAEISQALGYSPEVWQKRWTAQHSNVLHTSWTAVPWTHFKPGLSAATPGQEGGGGDGPLSPPPNEARLNREERLKPWMTDRIWEHYEAARTAFEKTAPWYLNNERGFDYALVHHQLSEWHTMRKQTRTYPTVGEDAAERCTLCGYRAALEPDKKSRVIDSQRREVRKFWRVLGAHDAVHEMSWGEERLCGVCAFRRLLVPLGKPENREDFNRTWTGSRPDRCRDSGADTLRYPFPSTAAVACQRFLRAVVDDDDAELGDLRKRIVAECRKAGWPPTFFPRSLPALSGLSEEAFLTYEPTLFFEHAREAEVGRIERAEGDSNGARARSPQARALGKAIGELMGVVKQKNRTRAPEEQIPLPRSRFALVALDGDGLGRLLLGDPEQMGVIWEKILHPSAVEQLRSHPSTGATGWNELLDEPRLVGPSLQAFLSRALGNFSHRIVPQVVEREFHGRLIYAGGDDILAMVDADDALPLCARLQQLYTAPWVLDTDPARSPWEHRGDDATDFNPPRDRGRLIIPDSIHPVSLPLDSAIPPVSAGWEKTAPAVPNHGWTGELVAMPGPYQSLSAGIVYAHFKTPLGPMIRLAHELLDDVAKEEKGRAAFAAAVYSRGGEKVRFGARWYDSSQRPWPTWPEGAARIDRVRNAFAQNVLPGRLPYKLREAAWALEAASPGDTGMENEAGESSRHASGSGPDRHALMEGLVRRSLSHGHCPRPLMEDVITLWAEDPTGAGLMLCRALAFDEEEE